MTQKRLRDRTEMGELNLLPILNMICLLIPFLLLAAQFVKIGVILVETPRLARTPTEKTPPEVEPLNLTLVMTDKGFYLKSKNGPECPAGVGGEQKLCFARAEGKLTGEVLRALQHHLWTLFADKYADPTLYATPEQRHHLTVIPEHTVSYQDLVKTLDTIREIPVDATHPRPPTAVPPGGCALERDPDSGAWAFREHGGASVRDSACMYYRVTLALSTS